ncbi:MAG: MFS transporter [Salinicola sp.]|uniref:MFS transporter n=1 Tax=uncultured Salinicola sp. TaxID=1193542 RepID=UPI000C991F53|nr:MFS transporter [uncultured Salinicola sp.]MAM59129.1 MFS transporter [Salinicola sp.]
MALRAQVRSPVSSLKANSALPWGALALLWLAGLYMRLPILIAPPLAGEIAESLSLGSAAVGALTTVPYVVLALSMMLAVRFARRIGMLRALVLALIIVAIGSGARGLTLSAPVLFTASVVMGLGLAVMQVTIPALLRDWTPSHLALGSAVYINGITVGELLGAGGTRPVVLTLAGGSWQLALLLWSLPALAIALLLVRRLRARAGPPDAGQAPDEAARRPVSLRSSRVWLMGIPLAASVGLFMAANAYMSSILDARGETELLTLALLFYNASPLAASLVMLWRGRRWITRRWPLGIFAALGVLGLVGFLAMEGWPALIALVISGFGITLELTLIMALPPCLERGEAVASLTAGMSFVGYSLAFVMPMVGGWMAEAFDRASLSLWPMLVFAALSLVAVYRMPMTARGDDETAVKRPSALEQRRCRL